ncbi:MAG: magnesium transporter, partial [Clostridia bacterium]|nr:magnesium transporter [Clostridia bacterium]
MENVEVRDLTETLKELLENGSLQELKNQMREILPADLAPFIDSLADEKELLVVYRLLSKDQAADCFVEIDPHTQEKLIEAFSDVELKGVLDELFMDDTIDIIEEMPANIVRRILQNTSQDKRGQINTILSYPPDSAGSLMTVEYVSFRKELTVLQAFDKIRKEGLDKETVYTCYVIDATRHLIGVVSVIDMLRAELDQTIESIMETNVVSVGTHTDAEEVVKDFDRYDFLALPVVDTENRLVGIVTVDDAMDVMREQSTEDIEIMAAVTPVEESYLKRSVFKIYLTRIPWLLILMISATFTGLIIAGFEEKLSKMVILTAYIPMLMDTGGNSGSQSSVTVIRALSLGDIGWSDFFKVVFKEMRVAVMCAITLGSANFLKITLLDGRDPLVSAAICLTLVCGVIVAKLAGATFPMVAKKLGLDP